MTRQEYMEELKKYLKRLPQEDFDNAIEYFSEYFEEAGPEKEQQVMRELGEPKEAARELFLNLLQESVEKDQDIVGEKAPFTSRITSDIVFSSGKHRPMRQSCERMRNALVRCTCSSQSRYSSKSLCTRFL